ncbi:transcriptional regulator [Pandoraea iniqua]|uniref:Transcriptional regulator n=1 Tax=Pandoraea iniqua TaxID=2508288 RepID=A0A5E4RFS6_9BURK|nr:metalloregulator ArsR/SmtB family transcription factor [Pandoraea iniqua]VVD60798.1 transcriptional regulator [Pandoraea iniqua]
MEELDRVFEKVSHYFSLLSEPTRLRILHALCGGEQSVSDVVAAVNSSQTNVSRHLNAMYQAGVLGRRKEGNQVYYTIADTGVVEICRAVCVQVAGRLEEEALPHRAVDGFMPRGQ